MKPIPSRFLAASLLLTASSFALAGATAGCGGDDTSSPSRPAPASDAGVDGQEASPPEDARADARADAQPKDAEPGPEAAPDVTAEGVTDSDGDGVADDVDVCPGFDDKQDGDDDGIPDGCDVCPTGNNDIDSDGDGHPDDCDVCPGLDESVDSNGSGVPDCREALRLWLRADRDVFMDDGAGGVGVLASDGDAVRAWHDQSDWSSDAEQVDPKRQPTFVEMASPSGGPAIRFTGAPEDTDNDDSLDGPLIITGTGARTVFLVTRTTSAVNSSILELNRVWTSVGSTYRITPEIGLRVSSGSALFANQPLDEIFHILAFQHAGGATTENVRAWYDGIPITPSSISPRTMNTGSGGYRLGDGADLGTLGFTGDIAEVVVYDEAMTNAQRDAAGLTLERKHGVKSWYSSTQEPTSVYLLAGQSNMVGQGDSEELSAPLNTTQGDVMAWMADSVGWTPLRWGSGNASTQFGPELNFGRAMADGDPEKRIALIKVAVNGTSLDVDWNSSTGHNTYADFVATLAQSRQRLDDFDIDYEIRGLCWMQGESDAVDAMMADAYQQNLQTFIAAVRSLVGVPDLPVALGRLRANMPPPMLYAPTVRIAQENVAAADPNVKIVDTDSLTLRQDEIHFDTVGQIALGQLFAEALQ